MLYNFWEPSLCSSVIATLNVIEADHLVEKSASDGEYVKKRFLEMQQRHPAIGDVRMWGLNGGIELVKDQKTKEPDNETATKVIYYAFAHGVVLITLAGNILRFQPPLVITRAQLDQALAVLDDAFSAVEQNQVELPQTNEKIGW